jgi:hypothetical protein
MGGRTEGSELRDRLSNEPRPGGTEPPLDYVLVPVVRYTHSTSPTPVMKATTVTS